MNILFTGASSFTGMWFIKELLSQGHTLTAIFPRARKEYTCLRRQRIAHIEKAITPVFSCPFGSDSFFDLIAEKPSWDLFCHHAADVRDYKSPSFDFAAALANNTQGIAELFPALEKKGCHTLLLTGSVFEPGEGQGSDGLRAVSPYGLSKGLTSQAFCYYATLHGFHLGKFVIPNPFGPYEEPRYTAYLMRTWLAGKTAQVQAPEYIRDNVPVTLLAKAYRAFADSLPATPGTSQTNPSFYAGTQGAFTKKIAEEMQKHLHIPCDFTLCKQTEYPEPRIRINTDTLDPKALHWNENDAWQALATYYQQHTS